MYCLDDAQPNYQVVPAFSEILSLSPQMGLYFSDTSVGYIDRKDLRIQRYLRSSNVMEEHSPAEFPMKADSGISFFSLLLEKYMEF